MKIGQLQLKHGKKKNLPKLAEAEPVFTTDEKRLVTSLNGEIVEFINKEEVTDKIESVSKKVKSSSDKVTRQIAGLKKDTQAALESVGLLDAISKGDKKAIIDVLKDKAPKKHSHTEYIKKTDISKYLKESPELPTVVGLIPDDLVTENFAQLRVNLAPVGHKHRIKDIAGLQDALNNSGGSGDMEKAVYDPTNIEGDSFARANHTGTQTASTISDFDTEVSNNADVVANTAKNTYPTADQMKMITIEVNADVTDEANVVSSLDGATLSSVTVATDDKVLIQDTSDSGNLKTVTAQSIADLGGGGGGGAQALFFSTDYSTLTQNYATGVSGSGASISYSGGELRMLSGSTLFSSVKIRPVAWSQQSGQKNSFFDRNPTINFVGKCDGNTAGSTGSDGFIFIGGDENASLGDGTAGVTKGMGFIYHYDSTGTEFYFFCADGTTATQSSDLGSSVTDNKHFEITMDMTSGTDIKCYLNGTLAATLSTNLPSGDYSAYPCVTKVINASANWSTGFEMHPKHLSIMIDPA
jgi:hypothetical protein